MRSAKRFPRAWTFVLATSLVLAACTTRKAAVLSQQAEPPFTQPAVTSPVTAPTASTRATVEAAYGKLPLHFEATQGQSDEQAQFLARGRGYTLFLTATEAVIVLQPSAVSSGSPIPNP